MFLFTNLHPYTIHGFNIFIHADVVRTGNRKEAVLFQRSLVGGYGGSSIAFNDILSSLTGACISVPVSVLLVEPGRRPAYTYPDIWGAGAGDDGMGSDEPRYGPVLDDFPNALIKKGLGLPCIAAAHITQVALVRLLQDHVPVPPKETDERETKKIIDTLLLLETWLQPPTVSNSPSSTQNWYLVAKESDTYAVFNMH
ncbi:hypothetical protein F5887DRAFT_921054 [Amanita rubescens]|nr:hypothetical protein F5887DRAFT_921054 [Amanita rubescens]